MTQIDYPKQIKTVLKQIKRDGGYSEETGEELARVIRDGGWLYGLLYSQNPLQVNEEDIVDFGTAGETFATLEYETTKGIYVPLYTSQDYARNVGDMVKLPNFPLHYVCKLPIRETLDRAVASNVKGVILNPQLEGILVHAKTE